MGEVAPNNMDEKKILRGRCLVEDCDCEEYCRQEGKSKCSFCGCYPAKHQRLIVVATPKDLNIGRPVGDKRGENSDSGQRHVDFSPGMSLGEINNLLKPGEMVTVGTLPNGAVVIDPEDVQISPIANAPTPAPPAGRSAPSALPSSAAISAAPTPAPPARSFSAPSSSPTMSPRRSPRFSSRLSPTVSPRRSPRFSSRLSPTVSPRRSPRFSSRLSPSQGPSRLRSDPQLLRSSPYKSPTHKNKTPSGEQLAGPSTRRKLFGDALKEREILLATCLPQIWPDDIAKVLKDPDVALDKLQRRFMIRTITERTIQNGFSAVEFDEVAEFTLKNIPHLRSKIIKGSGALVAAMKACVRYKRSYEHKKSRKALENDDKRSAEEIQSEMKEEMKKPQPSIHVLKGQLTALRKKRQERARASSAGQHLLDFPALENSDLVLWEFSQLASIKLEVMVSRLQDALPKYAEYFQVDDRSKLSPDVLAVATIMEIINSLGKKGKSGRASRAESGMLRIHEVTTLVAETVPKDKDHPCLVAIGDPEQEDLHVVVYVDTFPIFAGKIQDALMVLIAAYYVFQVSWPAADKLPLILLTATVIPEKMVTEIKKIKTVFAALEAIIKAM